MSLPTKTRSALLAVLILLSGRELCDFARANDSPQSWPTKEWQTSTPEEQGMDSAADLPKITQALLDRGYSAEDIKKILGRNLMRVFREVEGVSHEMQAAAAK